ncbi:BASS4 [Scenedesmus sp. PABB004]|nr:BASS4 [Scenedesmus sp. PABB004]
MPHRHQQQQPEEAEAENKSASPMLPPDAARSTGGGLLPLNDDAEGHQHQQQHQQQQQQRDAPAALALEMAGPPSSPGDEAAANNAAGGGPPGAGPQPAARRRWAPRAPSAARVRAFVVEHFMLLSFTAAAGLALAWPVPGVAVASLSVGDVRVVQAVNNFVVFLISGLTLKSDDFRALLRGRGLVSMSYGLFAILAVTPCFGFAVLRLPLTPHEFAVGLAIFCVVPTTLGVGVALTAAAKGNQALALLLTVATNLLGIVTVPYELRLVLSTAAGGSSVSVDPANLVVKLLITVLVPSVLGKAAREASARVRAFVTRFRTPLSLFSTLNLACIVWQTLSGARGTLLQQPFTAVLLVVLASAALHVAMLLLNAAAVWGLRLPLREGVATVIMSSQKSAPVAVTVISYLTPDLKTQGLLAIPCILGQLGQIFIGSALAARLRRAADKGG